MNREDFEIIYSRRHEESDRKVDIKETPVCKILFESEPIEDTSYFLLDIMVENTGTKSIGFDVDLRIYHRRGIKVFKKFEWENQFEDQGLSSINPQYFPLKVDPTLGSMRMEKLDDFTKITGNKLRFEEYEMGIPQKD